MVFIQHVDSQLFISVKVNPAYSVYVVLESPWVNVSVISDLD